MKFVLLLRFCGCLISLLAFGVGNGMAQTPAVSPAFIGYRAGFDIGSQGIKLSIIGFYQQQNRLKYKLVYNRQETIGLVKGMEMNGGKLRDADIQEAVATIREMVQDVSTTYKLTPRDFILYTSSGVNMATNVAEVNVQTQKLLGMPTNVTLSTKVEATYSVRAGMATEDYGRAILVDVGGGNLKGGILQPYQSAAGTTRYTFKSFMMELGTRRLAERVQLRTTNPASYVTQLRAMLADSVAPKIRSSLNDNPGINDVSRSVIYLTGGAAYQFITWRFPERLREDIVEFTLEDMEQFTEMLYSSTGWLDWQARTFETVDDPKLRELIKQDHVKATKKVYNREACLAGTLLAQEIFQEIGNLNTKTFYFTRDAYWINVLVFNTYKDEFRK